MSPIQALHAHLHTPWPQQATDQDRWAKAAYTLVHACPPPSPNDRVALENTAVQLARPAWIKLLAHIPLDHEITPILSDHVRQQHMESNAIVPLLRDIMLISPRDDMWSALICVLHDVLPDMHSKDKVVPFIHPHQTQLWSALLGAIGSTPGLDTVVPSGLWAGVVSAHGHSENPCPEKTQAMMDDLWKAAANTTRFLMWKQAYAPAPSWAKNHVRNMTKDAAQEALKAQIWGLVWPDNVDPDALALSLELIPKAPPAAAFSVIRQWGKRCPNTPHGVELTRALWDRQMQHPITGRETTTLGLISDLVVGNKTLVLSMMLGERTSLTPRRRAALVQSMAGHEWTIPPQSFCVLAAHTPHKDLAQFVGALLSTCGSTKRPISAQTEACLLSVWDSLSLSDMTKLISAHPRLEESAALKAATSKKELQGTTRLISKTSVRRKM